MSFIFSKEKGLEPYSFLILKNDTLGTLCGYVGIPESHIFYRKHYNQYLDECSDYIVYRKGEGQSSIESLLSVHGGVTFTGNTLEGMDPHLWYIGFDCAHAGDLILYLPLNIRSWDDVFRDEIYVMKELESLLEQLKMIQEKGLPSEK